MQEDTHVFQGMKRDFHPIKQPKEFLWEAHNIRLTTRDDSTMLSITNELGTKKVLDMHGSLYIGHAVVGNWLVLFTKDTSDNHDSIWRVNLKNLDDLSDGEEYVPTIEQLVDSDQLHFDVKHPIQTFVDVESEFIQKVYWIDGINRPRVINITKAELLGLPVGDNRIYTDIPFDFVQDLQLNEKIIVERINTSNGIFPAGVIQYAFTYYYKYGQESNIFDTSELLYISHPNRGGSPEDNISTAFHIKIENVDTRFQYLRIYSIIKTSIDAEATVKRVTDIEINNSIIEYTDTGTTGDIVDNTQLLSIGGKDITAGCIAAKDGTMFLGNITYNRTSISDVINPTQEIAGDFDDEEFTTIKDSNGKKVEEVAKIRKVEFDNEVTQGYVYQNQLSKNTSTFKSGDTYRLGLQFQYKTGEWSQPIFIKDYVIPNRPTHHIDTNKFTLDLPIISRYLQKILKAKDTGDKTLNIKKLVDNGYKKVRPLIVRPENKDRTILAQGILCPTVYNIDSRFSNRPFSQSSWFLRPFYVNSQWDPQNSNINPTGMPVPFKHLEYLKSNDNRQSEIQNIQVTSGTPEAIEVYNRSTKTLNSDTTTIFGIDWATLTMHSPDIEFNTNTALIINNNEQLMMNIVGLVQFNYNYGDISIKTSTAPLSPGANDRARSIKDSTGVNSLASDIFYRDAIAKTSGEGADTKVSFYTGRWNWMTYLWHRSGSLNNDIVRPDGSTRSAVLKKKVVSNLKVSNFTHWISNLAQEDWNTVNFRLSGLQVFNSNEVSLLKIPDIGVDDLYDIYYGNVDYLSIKNLTDTSGSSKTDYDVRASLYSTDGHTKLVEPTKLGDFQDAIDKSSEGVRIKYKSTPHAVMALKYPDEENKDDIHTWCRRFIPEMQSDINKVQSIDYNDPRLFWIKDNRIPSKNIADNWDDEYRSYSPPAIEPRLFGLVTKPSYGYLYLAELYRTSVDNRYGGKTPEALQDNSWIVAGPSVRLPEEIGNTIIDYDKITIDWMWGDTWYQRYDCLKTYPFTEEDENQMVEIGSFMCETRVNIDGRYDRNRGLISNLDVSPSNFNLINPIYSQLNNFFTYRIYDEDYYKSTSYPSQIIWTNYKNPGAILDSWTNLHLSSSIDLDSTNGAVTAIQPWNEVLLGFQESAINQILFNSRVQIQASDGVPIEIANSQKVEGTRIYSDTIGCQDKFGLVPTPIGVYFIDNNSASIYKFDGSLHNLSAELGTLQWMRENRCDYSWTPLHPSTKGHNGIRLYYDPKYQDVYFTPGPDRGRALGGGGYGNDIRYSLCYSEQLGQFTSLMSYGGTIMFASDSNLYTITYVLNRESGAYDSAIWQNFVGEPNILFDKAVGFDFSFISNDNPTITKVFDTIDMRVDRYTNSELDGNKYTTRIQSGQPFNFIRVSNEYQDTDNIDFNSSNLRKKFRIWRANIPRNKGTRERIRNPWTKITLGVYQKTTDPNEADKSRVILHDLDVRYTV